MKSLAQIATILVTALCVAWPGAPAAAQPVPAGVLNVLKSLPDAKRRDLVKLIEETQDTVSECNSDLRRAHRELADVYRSYNLNEGRARSLIRDIQSLEGRRLNAMLQAQVGLRRALSRDQYSRVASFLESLQNGG